MGIISDALSKQSDSPESQPKSSTGAQSFKTPPSTTDKKSVASTQVANVAGIILFVMMIGLTVYALREQRDIYESLSRSNKLMQQSTAEQAGLYQNYVSLYQKKESELDRISRELAVAQQSLNQTQSLVADLRNTNQSLESQMVALKEAAAASAASLNAQAGEISDKIKTSLDANEVKALQDIKAASDGQAMIDSFKEKIKFVKQKISEIRRQEKLITKENQKQLDLVALENGNQGFLAKDGQWKTAVDGSAIAQGVTPVSAEVQTATGNKVDINVRFIEK